jgi:hypothetical protein
MFFNDDELVLSLRSPNTLGVFNQQSVHWPPTNQGLQSAPADLSPAILCRKVCCLYARYVYAHNMSPRLP